MSYMSPSFDKARTQPLLFGNVIELWRGDGDLLLASDDWLSRTPSVRYRYGLVLERLDKEWGNVPLLAFEDPRAKALIFSKHQEMSSTPRAADEMVRILRALFEFARRHAFIGRNPTTGLKEHGCTYAYGEVFWTDREIERFATQAVRMGMPELTNVVKLIAATGLRFSEAINLKHWQVQEFAIVTDGTSAASRKHTHKALPLLPEAKRLIERLRDENPASPGDYVLLTSAGVPWEYKRLYRFVNEARNKAKIVHEHDHDGLILLKPKQLNDLRKNYALKLMKAGLTDSEIISLMNWTHLNVSNLRKAAGYHAPRCRPTA